MCNILHARPLFQRSRLRTTLLRDSVHDRVRDAIVDGTLAPGEVVRDTELATWLGVSRTPVREALLRLGGTGLVRAAPGRSTVVAEIDLAEVREAHAVVATMHRLAVAEAVARLTPADLDRMREANARFAAAIDAHDTDAALAADDAFHAVAVVASANRALATVLDQFGPVVRRLERLRFASVAGAGSSTCTTAWSSPARPVTPRPPPRSPSAPGTASPT